MLGNQIKYFRQQKQVKQDQLAEYLGVSYQAVSKWATGASDPDISLLPKLAIFFGVSIDELFEIPYEEQMERIENMLWDTRVINPHTFEQSVSFLEGRLRHETKDLRALINLAYLYNHRAKSDHDIASGYAQKVLELDPEEKSGWVAYLEANNGLCGDNWYDNHFEVIRFCQNILDKHPDNYRALYALLENMLADCRFEEALPYVDTIKKVRKNHQHLLYQGDILLGQGKTDQALAVWEKMVEEYPDIWQAHCNLGERYQKLGMLDKALVEFEKSFTMQEAPCIYDGLCSMAQIHELQKNYPQAIDDYKRILDCLKNDYGTTEGEQVDQYVREISRLKKL